ncbi:hypothetical protein ABEB36_009812 [Hypothenemus hampei]|uniref:Uncharacterized protein n=1 Tax=Hypothenemus hampei TaxID=57062 RepID=A0ABD1EJP7_HYPHA
MASLKPISTDNSASEPLAVALRAVAKVSQAKISKTTVQNTNFEGLVGWGPAKASTSTSSYRNLKLTQTMAKVTLTEYPHSGNKHSSSKAVPNVRAQHSAATIRTASNVGAQRSAATIRTASNVGAQRSTATIRTASGSAARGTTYSAPKGGRR